MIGTYTASGEGIGEPRGAAATGRPGQHVFRSSQEERAMRYIFGEYVLDTQRQELHRAGEPIKLRRKVFQVLA
jgi:DNA-binding response OmpR family regulator